MNFMIFLEVDLTHEHPSTRILDDLHKVRDLHLKPQFDVWAATSCPGDIFVVLPTLYFIRLKAVTYYNPDKT